MLAVTVKFRDAYGRESLGELVNPSRVMVEMGDEVVHVDQENPVEVAVMTCDGETLMLHRIPTLAIIDMAGAFA